MRRRSSSTWALQTQVYPFELTVVNRSEGSSKGEAFSQLFQVVPMQAADSVTRDIFLPGITKMQTASGQVIYMVRNGSPDLQVISFRSRKGKTQCSCIHIGMISSYNTSIDRSSMSTVFQDFNFRLP